MKIGFFDSGLGGLDTLFEFRKMLPDYDYIYLADNKNNPYGEKLSDTIKNLTYQGLNFLFSQGAGIVILACNTAASTSIKTWQKNFSEKKVLSVTIPAVEKIVEKNYKNILVLCTDATKNSGVFENKYNELKGKNNLDILATPTFVPLIETGQLEKLEKEIKNIFQNFEQGNFEQKKSSEKKLNQKKYDACVLGCTHYPILENIFQKYFVGDIINPGKIAAQKFVDYLARHQEIEKKLTKNKTLEVFYTGANNFEILKSKRNHSFETKKVKA